MHALFLCCVVKQKCFLTEHEYANAIESLNAVCQLRGTATEVLWIIVGLWIIIKTFDMSH